MYNIDAICHLRDGRRLAYTEHGDPAGKPLFFIHGNPGSRLMRHPDESIAADLGARIITPDRPGFGRSDFQPNRRIIDMPGDITQLADMLHIGTFSVFGVSAGSPYVAACAHKLPDRVMNAAIVSGVAPMNRPGSYAGMHPTWKTAFRSTAMLPSWLLRIPLWVQSITAAHSPEQALTNFSSMLTKQDLEKLSRPEIRERVQRSRAEAARRGHRGWVHEGKLIMSPWGFALNEVSVPVHLWYWKEDKAIPLQMGHYLASKLPHSIEHFFPGGGHLSIYDYWGDIIRELLADRKGRATGEVIRKPVDGMID